ncbi:hypothetical protein FIBSPDRAFT_953587 [Athelia psychrophila]|uniref:Uncharacterized protein n=1 Tax=Athelia psychrophila TaxID=1759441 RepID=A0A166K646_9AGAM|nr:hypothetical protein FIBSPDRAFT_953587 [Fibularhizoctonia sp. CBS 109695]
MNNFFNNNHPSYKLSSPETPADGKYESFSLDLFMPPPNGDQQPGDGQHPQSGSWGSFLQQPVPDHTYEPSIGFGNYGAEDAGWAGYGGIGDTVDPLHTLHTHWHSQTNSVDDPPNRPTESLSSVLKTEQNNSINQGSFLSPSPPSMGLPLPTPFPTSPAPRRQHPRYHLQVPMASPSRTSALQLSWPRSLLR